MAATQRENCLGASPPTFTALIFPSLTPFGEKTKATNKPPAALQMHIRRLQHPRPSFFKYQMRVASLFEALRPVENTKRADPERRRGYLSP
jgi:hypothetical protein